MASYICECGRLSGIWATRCYVCQEQDSMWRIPVNDPRRTAAAPAPTAAGIELHPDLLRALTAASAPPKSNSRGTA